MVIDLNLYGLETLIQDVKSFTPGFPESLLNKVINKFEVYIYKYYFNNKIYIIKKGLI